MFRLVLIYTFNLVNKSNEKGRSDFPTMSLALNPKSVCSY